MTAGASADGYGAGVEERGLSVGAGFGIEMNMLVVFMVIIIVRKAITLRRTWVNLWGFDAKRGVKSCG